MAEILPWLFFADDQASVVVNKDSSLMAAWRIWGVDVESAEEGRLEEVAARLDDALRRLGDQKIQYWLLVHREPYEGYRSGEFDNEISGYVDEVWGSTLSSESLYQNAHYLVVSMATKGAAMSLGELTRDAMDGGKSLPAALAHAVKSRLRRGENIGFRNRDDVELLLRRFRGVISHVVENVLQDLSPSRLIGDEMQGFLKATASANGYAPVAVNPREYLDTYLCDTFVDNQYTDYLLLNGVKKQYVGVFTLKNAPPANNLQGLNPLLAMPVKLRIATTWMSYSAQDADKFLSAARTFDELRSLNLKRLLRAAAASVQGGDDPNAGDQPTTKVGVAAQELREAVRRREGTFGAMAISVCIYADTPEDLEIYMDQASRILERTRNVFIRERDGSLSGFCTGIPGQAVEIVRWHFVEASNVTDASPIVTLDSGDAYHPFLSEVHGRELPPNATFSTRYSTVQHFNYHTGQLGHTLLIGPSRNGKTMLQMFLESQFFKYPNARIFNFDKDLSCKPQTLLMDGVHIDLDPARGGGLRLNPISLAREEHGRAWLIGWLDRLMAYRGDRLTDHDIEDLYRALTALGTLPGARMTTLLSQLPSHLRARLLPWCEGGAFGAYFDHSEDDFSIGRMTTVEVGSLLSAGLYDVVRAFTDYAFYRIERFLMDRDPSEMGPTLIYFEEAGFLLDDPIFADKARDYLMTLAKKRAFIVMTAQSPEPFLLNQKLGASVRDNVATIIFMPNSAAGRPDLGGKYKEAFGINDTQCQLIATATPRQEYCIYQPQRGMFRVVRAQFPREIVACLRSDADALGAFNRFYDQEDPAWKEKYLGALLD